ncbi:MAG: hypothetical protein QGG54_19595, partial [Gammaproteobacteria bacterium]|nr:hypothetical protein [Gammaproteobacteria bacterium]
MLPSPTRSATDTSTVLPSPTRSATETSDPTLTTEPTTETRIAASVPTPSGISCGDYPCDDDIGGWLNRIQLPAGFMALYVASMPAGEQPTSISVGPGGRLFAAAMGGAIYVFAHDGTPSVYAEGLHLPTGIAFRPGTDEMFVASRVFPPNVS